MKSELVEFVDEEGIVVELPVMKWWIENKHLFRSHMPISEVLMLLPNWVLIDVSDDRSHVSTSRAATYILLGFEALWAGPNGELEATDEEFAAARSAFMAVCALEAQRRMGLLKYKIIGAERLLHEPTSSRLEITMNPAIAKNPKLHAWAMGVRGYGLPETELLLLCKSWSDPVRLAWP